MNAKNLIWPVLAIASLPSVFAALPDLFAPVFEIIGPGGFASLYIGYEAIWDSIIVTTIMVSLVHSTVGKKWGKGMTTGLGAALSVALWQGFARTGFSLGDMFPLAFLILLIALGGCVYKIIHEWVSNRYIAFCIALLAVWLGIMGMGKVVFGEYGDSEIFKWAGSTVGIATASVFIWGITKAGKGISSIASGRSQNAGRLGGMIDDDLSDVYGARQRAQQLANDRRAEIAELEAMEQSTGADEAAVNSEGQELGRIQQEDGTIITFAKSAREYVDALSTMPPTQAQEAIAQLDGQKPALEAELRKLSGYFDKLFQRIASEHALKKEEAFLEHLSKNVDKEEHALFDTENKIATDIEEAENAIRQKWKDVEDKSQNPQLEREGPLAQFTQTTLPQVASQFEQHVATASTLKQQYVVVHDAAERIQKNQAEIRSKLDERAKARERVSKIIEELPKVLVEANENIVNGISLRSVSLLDKGIASREKSTGLIKDSQLEEIEIAKLDDTLLQLENNLAEDIKLRLQQEPPLLEGIQKFSEQQKILLSEMDAVDVCLQASAAVFANRPDTLQNLDTLGLQELSRATFEHNRAVMKAHVDNQLAPMLQTLKVAVSKPKASATYTQALNSLAQRSESLKREWSEYLLKKTAEADRQRLQMRNTGIPEMERRARGNS